MLDKLRFVSLMFDDLKKNMNIYMDCERAYKKEMKDYKKAHGEGWMPYPYNSNTQKGACMQDGLAEAFQAVMDAPTIEAEPVRHGQWVDNGIPESVLSKCSECGIVYGSSSFNYCPNCGAKMDGKE